MKVIKKGTVVSFVCASCGCEFVAGIHAVKDENGNYYVHCPICGAECYADVNARDQKWEIPEYPCKTCCSASERAACCGCEKERQWQKKYGEKTV